MYDLADGQQLLLGVLQVNGKIHAKSLFVLQQASEDVRQLHLVKVHAIEVLVDEELFRELGECLGPLLEVLQVEYASAAIGQFELMKELLLQISQTLAGLEIRHSDVGSREHDHVPEDFLILQALHQVLIAEGLGLWPLDLDLRGALFRGLRPGLLRCLSYYAVFLLPYGLHIIII